MGTERVTIAEQLRQIQEMAAPTIPISADRNEDARIAEYKRFIGMSQAMGDPTLRINVVQRTGEPDLFVATWGRLRFPAAPNHSGLTKEEMLREASGSGIPEPFIIAYFECLTKFENMPGGNGH